MSKKNEVLREWIRFLYLNTYFPARQIAIITEKSPTTIYRTIDREYKNTQQHYINKNLNAIKITAVLNQVFKFSKENICQIMGTTEKNSLAIAKLIERSKQEIGDLSGTDHYQELNNCDRNLVLQIFLSAAQGNNTDDKLVDDLEQKGYRRDNIQEVLKTLQVSGIWFFCNGTQRVGSFAKERRGQVFSPGGFMALRREAIRENEEDDGSAAIGACINRIKYIDFICLFMDEVITMLRDSNEVADSVKDKFFPDITSILCKRSSIGFNTRNRIKSINRTSNEDRDIIMCLTTIACTWKNPQFGWEFLCKISNHPNNYSQRDSFNKRKRLVGEVIIEYEVHKHPNDSAKEIANLISDNYRGISAPDVCPELLDKVTNALAEQKNKGKKGRPDDLSL